MPGARARPTSGSSGSGGGGAGGSAVLRFMNRRLAVYRGDAVNPYGDVSNVGELFLDDVPAALAEVSQNSFDPATQRPSIIRAIKCIVPGWADIDLDDTIQDKSTGFFYLVESAEAEPGLGYRPPRRILTLRQRSGVSVAGERGPE